MSAVAEPKVLPPADLLTRMRWYATLNTWKNPPDFPWPLPPEGHHDEQGNDRYTNVDARAAFRAVTDSLTDAEMSLGWWVYSLNRSVDEWAEWWSGRERAGGVDVATATAARYTQALELARLGGDK